VACVSLIVSILIYYIFRNTFRHVEGGKRAVAAAQQNVPELSLKETKERMIALVLVYAVIIFFWMAFHQNGLSLTYFANEFTAQSSSGLESMWFDVFNLVMIILIIYAGFSLRDAKTGKAKAICWGIIAFAIIVLIGKYLSLEGEVAVSAPIFQHFNPFYVVALTPFSMALFAYLGRKGKAPSAPRKIAWGMIIAAFAFLVLAAFSVGLPQPQTEMGPDGYQVAKHVADQSPYLLIGTYLILTFAELLLSPMGISFVTKVAPPKYKGMMMGGWFVATAIGNQLVMVGGLLWGPLPLWAVWSVFIVLCLLAALFMFSIMKRLEKVAK
jgi:POT family proton-dependent oligopeptide transporter